MDSLRSLSSPTSHVVRGSQNMTVATIQVVPGDMVELKTGDTIPADIRLTEVMNFETDEALLTGESLPVQKIADETYDPELGPGDRLNIAYSSSTVTKGRAKGIVFATGMYTEIGTIAAALRSKNSRVREPKRTPEGRVRPHRQAQAWALTGKDLVGNFLGVNVGTPLQRVLSRLACGLFVVAVIFAVIVLAANNFSNQQEVIIYAVATGLSMLPASLIVVLTITMAAGTKRMVERHVIVRKLNALEALGAVTDICSDKTGTLTQGKMVAKKAWIPSKGTYSVGESSEPVNPTVGALYHSPGGPDEDSSSESDVAPGQDDHKSGEELLKGNGPLEEFLKIASLANLASVYKSHDGAGWTARGDPTEIAIQVFASRFGWKRRSLAEGEDPKWKLVTEYPFSSDVKRMSVIFQKKGDETKLVFTKGAVERVLEACVNIDMEGHGQMTELTEEIKQDVLSNMESLASLGLRVLALASKAYDGPTGTSDEEREQVETALTFRGLIGLFDPPRPESKGAVKACHQAGISVHMLTGDHPGTALAIAKQIGIVPDRLDQVSRETESAMVTTAAHFDRLTDQEIDDLPVLPLVIARCAPQTKVRMIEALHRRKAFAAMTGDGVNDSPSLKHADVGIAMGQAGSDVAKDASDIVLTDDNFASILNAVEEGRRIFDNIQKFVLHLLSQNIAQACTLLIGLAFKDSNQLSVFPLSPVSSSPLIYTKLATVYPDQHTDSLPKGGNYVDHHGNLWLPGHGSRSRGGGARHPLAATAEPEARHLHHGAAGGHGGVRSMDGGALLVVLLARDLPLGRWHRGHRLQLDLLGPVRHRVQGAGDVLRLHDVVFALPGLGADQLPAVLFPHAAQEQEILYPVDARRVAQQVSILVCHVRLCLRLCDPLRACHQPRGLQTYGHHVGVGYRHCRGRPVLWGNRELEVGQARLL